MSTMDSPYHVRPSVIFDDIEGVIQINGVRYAYELFRHFGYGEVGRKFTISERKDGIVTLCTEPAGE